MGQTAFARARTTPRLWNRSFTLASFAFLVVMMGTTLPTSLYPLYRDKFALSEMMITVIYGVYAAGTIAALVVAGSWSDQLGRRSMMFAALAFSVASGMVFLFDANLPSLLLARVLSGISSGLAIGTATVMVIELAPAHRRGAATLIAAAANMGGLGLGPLFSGILAEYAPWPMHLVFIADIALVVIAAVGLLKTHETVATPTRPQLHVHRPYVPREVRSVFIPACIAGFAGFAVLGLLSAVTPAFLGKVLGLSNLALIGSVVFVVFAASTLGQLALEVIPPKLALPAGCAVLAMGALLVGAAINVGSLILLILGAALSGLGQGLGFRAGLAEVAAAAPADQRGEVTSTFFVVLYIAISIPVIGVGIAANALGLRLAGTGFAIAAAALSVIALLALQFRRRMRRTSTVRKDFPPECAPGYFPQRADATTTDRNRIHYHSLSIGIHWLTLALLVAVYSLIELRGFFPKGTAAHDSMMTWHEMLGFTVLLLTIGRLALRWVFRAPPITPAPPAWMHFLAEAMHVALYAFLLVMPVLGWLTLSAKGKVIPFFGLHVPPLLATDKALGHQLEDIHEIIGNIGYWLIGLHAAAALFHHYVMRDDTLLRMLPGRRKRIRPASGDGRTARMRSCQRPGSHGAHAASCD